MAFVHCTHRILRENFSLHKSVTVCSALLLALLG